MNDILRPHPHLPPSALAVVEAARAVVVEPVGVARGF